MGFQALSLEKFEATPIALDGVLYTVQPPNDVIAIDGATGRTFWTYTYEPSPQARPCCGRVNRGLAILGDSLFMGTIDGRLVALDAKSGANCWNVAVGGARPEAGYAFTVAPLVVKDKIIVGPGRRRLWRARLHRRLRCRRPARSVALQHDSGTRRERA